MGWMTILKKPYRLGGESYEWDRSPEGKKTIERLNREPFPNITYSKLYHGFQGNEIKNIEETEDHVKKYFSPNIYQSTLYAFLGWHESESLTFKDKGKPRLIQLLPTKEMVNLDYDFGIMGIGPVRAKKENIPNTAVYRPKFHDKLNFKEVPSNRVKSLALEIIKKLEDGDTKMRRLLADTQEYASIEKAINQIKLMLQKYF